MAESKESITESIKEFRKRMNVSQEELSQMCGYSSTYIGKIERGERSPSLDTLIRIAEALQIPLASLFDPFYRRRSQRSDDWEPDSFSPYDATFRRFNYLVGRLSPDGNVKQIFHLPWFESGLPQDEDQSEKLFWELPYLNFSSSAQDSLSKIINELNPEEPAYLSLKIAGYDFLEEPTDLVFEPVVSNANKIKEIRFELFFPRVVRKGSPVPLKDIQFALTD